MLNGAFASTSYKFTGDSACSYFVRCHAIEETMGIGFKQTTVILFSYSYKDLANAYDKCSVFILTSFSYRQCDIVFKPNCRIYERHVNCRAAEHSTTYGLSTMNERASSRSLK